MIIISILLFLSFIFSSCERAPPHIREADYVMNDFTKKMKNKGLYLIGSGGAMRGDIQKINLGYRIQKKINLEEARILFLTYSEDLLRSINGRKKIQPYLHDFPFTSKNIYFALRFVDNQGNYVEEPYIAYIFINTSKDEIAYFIYDRKKKGLECIHIEPYQDALKIYQESVN